jgi:hypothetical protein
MQGFARVSFLSTFCRRETWAPSALFSRHIASRAIRGALLREGVTVPRVQLDDQHHIFGCLHDRILQDVFLFLLLTFLGLSANIYENVYTLTKQRRGKDEFLQRENVRKEKTQPKPSEKQTHAIEDTFERMYLALLDYHFEKVDFLAMLTRWEEILGLSTLGEKKADIQEIAS